MPIEHPAFIAQGGFNRLKELRRVLLRAGVDAEIVGPPDGRLNG